MTNLWDEITEFVKDKKPEQEVVVTVESLNWLLESRRLMNEKSDIIRKNREKGNE